jgi:hypothetical protein
MFVTLRGVGQPTPSLEKSYDSTWELGRVIKSKVFSSTIISSHAHQHHLPSYFSFIIPSSFHQSSLILSNFHSRFFQSTEASSTSNRVAKINLLPATMNPLIAASALVSLALISPCPAPPAVARVIAKAGPTILTNSPGSTGDSTAGINGISMVTRNVLRHDRRQINLPSSVSQHILDQCTQSMADVTIVATEKGNNSKAEPPTEDDVDD